MVPATKSKLGAIFIIDFYIQFSLMFSHQTFSEKFRGFNDAILKMNGKVD